MTGLQAPLPTNAHFFNVREAAAYIRVCTMTMYTLAKKPRKKGGPPVRKFGKHIRFPREAFILWANGEKGTPANV